jgi:hypothetical protein
MDFDKYFYIIDLEIYLVPQTIDFLWNTIDIGDINPI